MQEERRTGNRARKKPRRTTRNGDDQEQVGNAKGKERKETGLRKYCVDDMNMRTSLNCVKIGLGQERCRKESTARGGWEGYLQFRWTALANAALKKYSYQLAAWSSGMILASGVRGPGFNS